MNKLNQGGKAVRTAIWVKSLLDDAIDAIEIHELEIAHRRAKCAIENLEELHDFDPRVSRAVDRVVCFVTLDCLDVAEIRKAQKNLEAVAAIGRTMIGEEHFEAQACAS